MRKLPIHIMIVVVLISALGGTMLTSIAGADAGDTGTIQFVANGEDFVRQGFTSKDGWDMQFDHVYITLGDVTAYQTDPPYDAEAGEHITSDVSTALPGVHTVDLAAGDADAEPIPVGTIADAPAGFYNALSFVMTPAETGPATGYSLVVIGTATKDGETTTLTLKFDDAYEFACGEYIGDVRKGILQAGGTTELEMTFHFDHLFGDAGTPLDDGLNVGALGFAPLAALAQDGTVDADMDTLQAELPDADYQMVLGIMPTLGHVGEGHCHCTVPAEVGAQFVANGEDFVREGFTSKDGWDIQFDHVYITLGDITAYQTDPPYDAEAGDQITSDVFAALPGVHTVDLAAGDADAEPIPVGTVADAPAGFYNALSFVMTPAESGPATGYSLVVIGTATKDGETTALTLKFDDAYEFACGEYIGDLRKGILQAGGTTELEMTFHFDHLFGDAGTPQDDGLNVGALGFAPLATLAQDGIVDANMDALQTGLSDADYKMVLDIMPTLGHVGEGHCHCAEQAAATQ